MLAAALALALPVGAGASSIWTSSAVPAMVDSGPDSAVELGVKFRSDVDGSVTGIRFYKGAGNTGTHIGSLWSSGGTLLATATFTGETASGWQEVSFAAPVAVSANAVYVASYHTDVGHYSVDQGYFAGQGADASPLHAPASAIVGGNGVFGYGSSSSFPSLSWNDSSYWVDVVFSADAGATPPASPEPAGWYAGDMHAHRSCGGSPASVASMYELMAPQNLAAVSLLADMGNGEVQDPATDLPLVNGQQDDPVSTPGRIVHWDAEWHWDPIYWQYPHQALGGHLVVLGVSEAHQIWEEYTYPILDWAHQKGGIAGFAHMQYLDNSIPGDSLSCCGPIEYPVEVALGASDFISEDVVDGSRTFSGMNPEAAVQAYYRLLNTGFRPGFAAGTDHPCDNGSALGTLLTYVQVPGEMTYRNWIDGIAKGRTVVSRNGHNEFLNLLVSGSARPGDEVKLASAGSVPVTVEWTANQGLSGTIEIVSNGVVVASKQASVAAGSPASLSTTITFPKSGWVAARRMNANGHQVHTAAVFVTVNGAPVRVSATDASFYVQWMDNLLAKTSPGGAWSSYFVNSLSAAQARYQAAKAIYQQIAVEAAGTDPAPVGATIWPSTAVPGLVDGGPDSGVELGVSFRSDVAGSIQGIRFYKASGNTGTHVGNLWSSTGTLLASAVFTGETSTGWQQVSFSSPVAIDANTVYVASYHAPSGHYSADVSYFSGKGMDSPPLHALADGVSGGNGLFAYGSTSAFPTQTWSSANYWVDVVFAAGAVTDPPVLTITTGALPSGAQGVPYSGALAASGGASPYTWSIPAGLPPGLSLDASTGLISGTPTATGSYSFTASVTDTAAQTAAQPLSIAIMPPGNYTLWPAGSAPNISDSGPDSAVELGVKFRSDVAGFVTGIRFYKGSGNTGTHVGSLWSSDGTRLGTATFTGETASGWQQVDFPAPVAIAANTVYVASYHTTSGHYADDMNFFAGKGLDNPPLHALADGVSGANGVYAYGSTSTFPSQGWMSSNYWVDAVFAQTSATLASITVSPASPAVVSGATQQLTATGGYDDGTTLDLTGQVGWTSSDPGVALVSATGLLTGEAAGSATISATLSGVAGSASVTVSPPPPPPSEGPGGPILIISSAVNPFSRYYTEILRAEGFNEFTAMDVTSVTSATLAGYDLAILGEFALTADQAAMLGAWVSGGGNLVAMRPDKQLAGLLGIADAGTTLAGAYLLVDTTSDPGKGIVGETMQFHGTADRYSLNGATAIASLYSSATTATSSPAVTWRTAGAGQAAAFTYDLARSVVYTRQGNPAWSGQARDGQDGPIRSDDLFFGAASFDPEPDWIDLGKVQIPQADEQQHLLANLILQMNQARKPLPRFWALPSGFKAAVVMTGDDHGADGTSGRFDEYLAASPPGCSVTDWECVRGTSYVYPNTPIASALEYLGQGFEIALHVNTECANFTSYEHLDGFYVTQLADFASAFPALPSPSTNRTHCIAWSDYDTQPKVELARGIRLDTSYYYWPGSWVNDRPGFMTGAGMPMRFADRTGQTIDVYQAPTQITDESGQTIPVNIDTLLDNATGPLAYYGVFTVNMHTDPGNDVAVAGSRAIVASAQAHGVPVVSAQQMLHWLDGRNASSFGSLSWNGGVLTFTVSVASGARNIQAMLPTQVSGRTLAAVLQDGATVTYGTQTIKGISYAVFGAPTGSYQATYR